VSESPIGIFDSGIGGLSVLRHIRSLLPHENLLYFADSGFAPYGDKTEAAIVERSLAIAEFLLQAGAKSLVVACNAATAAAIKAMRARHPDLPVVGVEPGLKPAAALTQSKVVGVLATASTLASEKFNLLLHEQQSAAGGVRFVLQACVGLADQIEKGDLQTAETAMLIKRYVTPLLEQGADTLVLGCTHYPFVQDLIEKAAEIDGAGEVMIIDTGEAVARQLARLLEDCRQLRQTATNGRLDAFTSGHENMLASAFSSLLKIHPPIQAITLKASGLTNG
jgi:glutamate racemase